MATTSPYVLARRIEADIARITAAADAFDMEAAARQHVKALKRDATDARLDIRDYELAETRAEQLALGKSARERLDSLRKGILAASQYNIFSAIEVAEVSASIDHLFEQLD